ncbi:MAG: hypothetical protein J3K34DRAFT_414997 [Monoraphidium minutum]|nr:MAG: hypothetical protein J3K34DRAFT_414997 [Monoraphidium minutum]
MPVAAKVLLAARGAMQAAGHDLVAVCDLRSEAGAGGRGSSWRWRFLVASCAADGGGGDERARTTPYLMAGGPPGAAGSGGEGGGAQE